MKFFIDTANLEEIREAANLGLLDGVTTNPTLLSRELVGSDGDAHSLLIEITKIVPGPVSAEVIALDAPGMVKEGLELRKIADNIVVKIPMTLEGLKAIRRLSSESVPTNCTLIFSPTQALMAAKAGATYASPFVGRLDDIAADGMKLIEQVVTIYRNYDYETQVLAASLRHPEHVVQSALLGADVITMPAKMFSQLAAHPLTDKGLDQFLADWAKVQNGGDRLKDDR